MNLTPRQLECMELAAQGLSSKQIARRMGITEATVKTHKFFAMRALGAANSIQAVSILGVMGITCISRCFVVSSEAETIVVTGRATCA